MMTLFSRSMSPLSDAALISLWLRAEAAAAFVCGVLAFANLGQSWWLFFGLFLAPDLALAGYLKGPRMGATIYNFAHSYVVPLALGLAGAAAGEMLAVALAAVWIAHIGLDRMLGYGLKLSSGFANTHLGRVGRIKA